jgi:hypothetical protein
MKPGRQDIDRWDGASSEGARAVLLRLLQKLTRPAQPPTDDECPPDSLPPPGQRSGEGTESLEPYLNQYRNSRPGPLE